MIPGMKEVVDCSFLKIFLFLFYNILREAASVIFSMQAKRQITAKILNKEKNSVRINEAGIFQFKENDPKHSKKLTTHGRNLYIKIVKTQILNNKYKFVLRISEDAMILQIILDGKEDLEKFYRIVGGHSLILGLQEIVASFKKIGEGSFAQVYEAITNYQSKFALKCFEKKGIQNNLKTKKAYLNELEVMKRLSNPYIVSFDYLFETEKAFYLKMEYFQKTLKDRIAGKMMVRNQKKFLRQMLLALEEMKSKGVIHRDLKPENVMIRRNAKGEEECVIIDFGLATVAEATPYLYLRCGTPGFLSPEIANLSNKTEKQACSSDMFSLGCIFYKMLTGNYLFAGKAAKQVLQNNRKCEYSSSFEGLSVKQKKLLVRMLNENPATRITPQEALKDAYLEEEVDDCDEIPEEECAVYKNLKKILHSKQDGIYSSMESLNEQFSSFKIYGSSRKDGLKDSCITFDLALQSSSNQEIIRKSSSSRVSKVRQSRFSKLNVL